MRLTSASVVDPFRSDGLEGRSLPDSKIRGRGPLGA